MGRATLLRFYGRLFLVCGVLFVAGERLILSALSWAGAFAGSPPLTPAGPSFWLGLTGSLMTAIALLSFRLAEDPGQPAAWDALLLSKAVSSSLFIAFALLVRSALFAASAVVDGLIFAHLFWLRLGWERSDPAWSAPHEVWFARVYDPKTGRALWARTVRERGESTCAVALFDPSGRVSRREWSAPFVPGLAHASGPDASWELRWRGGECPAVDVVPPWLRALGLSRSGYRDLAPDAVLEGAATLGGERWEFSEASGCIGRVWGGGGGPGWWWAHAVLRDGDAAAVLEILSAPGPLGLRATSAFLWRGGRLLRASGPLALFRSRSRREEDRWSFRVRFPGMDVEGECVLGPAATVEYGGGLVCRNSKLSTLRLSVGGAELRTDAAAVEFVERRS